MRRRMHEQRLSERLRRLRVPKLTIKLGRYLFSLIVLGLAVHLLLPQLVNFRHSIQVLRKMSVLLILCAAFAQILSYIGNGYMIRSLLSTAKQHLGILRCILMIVASASVGLVAVGTVGNSAAMYGLARRAGIRQEGALMASWLPAILNNAVLLVFALIGMAQLFILHDLSYGQLIGFGLAVLFLFTLAGGILWGAFNRSRILDISIRISRGWARFRRHQYSPEPTMDAVDRIFLAGDGLRSGKWRGALAGAAGNVLFDMLTLYLVFNAAGFRVGPGVLLGGYGLPLFLSKFTFLPGGIGLIEGTMAAIYISLGVPGATAVVVILTYRILSFWIPTILGFPLFIYLNNARHAAHPL
jgi:uncharacterized membrane protein YbhN (UPF0104 family)